jgi:hypothetical protein
VSWHQQFFDPIILPSRKPLVTLRDAANYIVKLPKAKQNAPEWQAAAEVLTLIGEHGGDIEEWMARVSPVILRKSRPRSTNNAGQLLNDCVRRALTLTQINSSISTSLYFALFSLESIHARFSPSSHLIP